MRIEKLNPQLLNLIKDKDANKVLHNMVYLGLETGLFACKADVIAAKRGFFISMCNLGTILFMQSKNEDAKVYLEKALQKGMKKVNLYLALISDSGKAEAYFKEALVVVMTLCQRFLMEQGRGEESLVCGDVEQEGCFSGEKPIVEESSATTSSDVGLSETVSIIKTSTEYSDSKIVGEPFTPTQQEEKYIIPKISKKNQRIAERAKKAEERLKSIRITSEKQKVSKSCSDVDVSIIPSAQKDLKTINEKMNIKIQGLISMLANGEYTRGKFEQLEQYTPPLYSMRITDKDLNCLKVEN